MEYFVDKHSVVRQIWGKADTILFIFAGASAEFALNKAVDWLYFTGRLPSDPLGRLFSTVSYSRAIVFSEKQSAIRAIDAITALHTDVEAKRGTSIPDWAYRDVLFMLIDYSIRSFEILERKLSVAEKRDVCDVFYRVGRRMGVKKLPKTFKDWERVLQGHLYRHLQHTRYSNDLFNQYRNHLSMVRYLILQEAQKLEVPEKVHELFGFRRISFLNPLIRLYKLSRSIKIDWLLKELILPSEYKNEIKALDRVRPCRDLRPSTANGRQCGMAFHDTNQDPVAANLTSPENTFNQTITNHNW